MKRVTRLLIVLLLMLMMIPMESFASAPEGYIEVNLTKKNFKNYLEVRKYKDIDAFGNYKGVQFNLANKQALYLLCKQGFSVKGSCKIKTQYKLKNKKKKSTCIMKIKGMGNGVSFDIAGWNRKGKYNYEKTKITNLKISKARGTLVYISPDNIIGFGRQEESDRFQYHNANGERIYTIIKLKHPYDGVTSWHGHVDDYTGEYIVDYYYVLYDETTGTCLTP